MNPDAKFEGLVGEPLDRVDGRLKVTGQARYSAEMPAVGVLHAVLVKSTIARGKVTKIETDRAKRAPGVLGLYTYAEKTGLPEDQQNKILPGPEVRYSGQHLAVVVADSLEHALEAADLVTLEYDVEKPSSVFKTDLLVTAHPPDPKGRKVTFQRGNVDLGHATELIKVQQVYKTPVEHHNPIEPHATIAFWEGDRLTVYDATQGVSNCQQTLAKLFGVPKENVRVISHFLGGGFGCKGQTWPHVGTAALAARLLGRPVKLVLRREDMFTSNGHRPETRQEIALAAGKDGKLVAWDQLSFTEVSPTEEFVEPVGLMPAIMYAVENQKIDHKLVALDVPPGTYMRAPGEASGSFGCECSMDELAYALQLDPIELRIRNYAEEDPEERKPWSSKSLRECYAKGAEAFGWSKRNPAVGSMKEGRLLVGMGVASATYPANYQPAAARAQLLANGRVRIQCGTQDIGTGTYTILSQIAADVLGVPTDLVQTEIGDSSLPAAPISGGSMSAASAGSSVYEAAVALRDKLIALAVAANGPFVGQAPESIFAHDGSLVGRDKTKIAYTDLLKRSGLPSVEATTKTEARDKEHSMHSFGAQFAEVRVDPDLGTIRLKRLLGAFAAGRILNAKTAESQLRGGIVWGAGMALLEETLMDPVFGRYVNMNLAEYHVPTNADIPAVEIMMIPERDPYVNPIGVKGIGEIGIVGAAAAIANAVYHAIGKRVRELPITLDKLL